MTSKHKMTLIGAAIALGIPIAAQPQSSGLQPSATLQLTAKGASPVGTLGANCSERAQRVRCTFTPAESRKYVINVFSAQCVRPILRFSGVDLIELKSDQRPYPGHGCRIGRAFVRSIAGRVVQIELVARTGTAPVTVWVEILKA